MFIITKYFSCIFVAYLVISRNPGRLVGAVPRSLDFILDIGGVSPFFTGVAFLVAFSITALISLIVFYASAAFLTILYGIYLNTCKGSE